MKLHSSIFIITILVLYLLPPLTFGQTLKTKKKKGNYYFYLDNKKVNTKPYTEIKKIYTENYHLVKANRWGLVDSLGNEIVSCKYDSISHAKDNYFIARLNDKYGVINKDDNIILDVKFQDIDYYYKDSIALVKIDDKWAYLKNNSLDFDAENLIFRSPEIMPKFVECDEKSTSSSMKCEEQLLIKFLFDNINYPVKAKQEGISGLVVVSFIVTETGDITSLKIVREIGGGCGEEAIRVIKKMPNWIPGQQDKINVKTLYTLPVRYKM